MFHLRLKGKEDQIGNEKVFSCNYQPVQKNTFETICKCSEMLQFQSSKPFLECENKICVFTQLYLANMKLGKNPSAHKLSLTNGIQIICNI